MIAVVQRVIRAHVEVAGQSVGAIERGLVVLVSVHADDTPVDVEWTAQKLTSLRIFPQDDKQYHLDVREAGGGLLLISNFTVAATTRQGRRPSFDAAAKGDRGAELFDLLVETVRRIGVTVETGQFGADMLVHIVNEGPATFLVDSRSARQNG